MSNEILVLFCQVFSYDIGVMARSHDHAHHHQQQQQSPGNDEDAARTTRL